MKLITLAAAAGTLLALAGCASTTTSSHPARTGSSTGSSAGSSAGSSTGSSTGSSSAVGLPAPAPSDSEPITVAGPVGVQVLSLTGPFEPAGPLLAATLPGLLNQVRDDLGGKAPSCPGGGCWHGAKVPAGSVLLAVRPAPNACSHVQHIQSVKPAAGKVELDIQLAGNCRIGAGSAARMPAMLIALDSSALPSSGSVSIEVRASLQAGQPMQAIGGVAASLPLNG